MLSSNVERARQYKDDVRNAGQTKLGCCCSVSVDEALVLLKELKKHIQTAEKWGEGVVQKQN